MNLKTDQLDMQLLPPLLREFVAQVGLEKTLRVVERCNGRRVYMPDQPEPTHWLSELIGQADAVKLARLCGSNFVVMPRAVQALRRMRNRELVAAREQISVNEAIHRFGLSRRSVQTIVADERKRQPGAAGDQPANQPAEQQPRLFD